MRCEAVHSEDDSACDTTGDAVRISDGLGGHALGCVHHGARLYAALETPTAVDGSVPGAAAAVIREAVGQTPLSWMYPPVTEPAYEPTRKELAEGMAEALSALLTQLKFGLLPDSFLRDSLFQEMEPEQDAPVRLASTGSWRDDLGIPPDVTNVFEYIEWAGHDAWDSWTKPSG